MVKVIFLLYTAYMSDSYTSGGQSFRDIVRQLTSARRHYSANIEARVTESISEIKEIERHVVEAYGIRIRDLDVLEIGPGQFPGQMTYLALHNRAIGADRDVIVQGFRPMQYVRMLRDNGPMRTAKTIGRKALGLDRRYRKELRRQLGVRRLPKLDIRRAGAANLPLRDRCVDFAYSRAVFQHLPDPGAVVRELIRVLRPGGVLYVSLHPYTSPTGCLDPRVLYGGIENELGLWPHLRPELQDMVRPNAFINKLGLRDWQRLFSSIEEKVTYLITPTDERYVSAAVSLKQKGHLQDYTVQELTVGALDVMFQIS
jgi:SAM-dependent methyltransferase